MPAISIIFSVLLHLLSNLIQSQLLNLLILTEPCKETFLISPCSKKELLEIISSLDNNKATVTKNIPIKILELAKEQIAKHLCFI